MRTLHRLAFLLEEFQTPSPAQHLLDRFLMGYPREGVWHRPSYENIIAYLMMGNGEVDFDGRSEEFGLEVAPSAEQAAAGADAVVVVPRRSGAIPHERFVQIALEQCAPGATCFVHGVLAGQAEAAARLLALARSRQVTLLAGTCLGVGWRLPDLSILPGTALEEGLIVVQGPFPHAEFQALEGLWSFLQPRAGAGSPLVSGRFLEGKELWKAGEASLWSHSLLASALSRSHSPQGAPVTDGRTQDLFGLGLVPKLARAPRGWVFKHEDGFSSTLLVLDGVVADFNVAARRSDKGIISTQLFRAPPPAEQHYSRLVMRLEEFFGSGELPWPESRGQDLAGLLGWMAQPASRTGRPLPLNGVLKGNAR